MPIHAPKIGVFGGFSPQNGEQWTRPQKAHPWAETRRMTYRSSKSVHICALGASRRIKQTIFKKVYLRNHNMCFFTCSPKPPTLAQRHMDLRVWSYPWPGYIFQVSSNPFRGFGAPGGQNLAFPITLASRFYNSLYYHTSRDINTNVRFRSIAEWIELWPDQTLMRPTTTAKTGLVKFPTQKLQISVTSAKNTLYSPWSDSLTSIQVQPTVAVGRKNVQQKAASLACHPSWLRTNPSDLDLHLLYGAPGQRDSAPKTASRSVHPFSHSSSVCPAQHKTTLTHRPRYVRHL